MTSLRLSLAGLAALLLTSCMVGPDYSRPSVPTPAAYKESPPAGEGPDGPAPTQSRQGWKVAQPGDQAPRGNWWEIFGDPQLNALEEQVTVANQDLKAAEARFRQARAMIGFARASEFPTISTGLGISSVRQSDNRPFRPSTASGGSSGDFSLSFDLSYELDLWGRIRRTP